MDLFRECSSMRITSNLLKSESKINDGKIMFGEMTFYDGSGYMKFCPDQFDFELGDAFVLPIKEISR